MCGTVLFPALNKLFFYLRIRQKKVRKHFSCLIILCCDAYRFKHFWKKCKKQYTYKNIILLLCLVYKITCFSMQFLLTIIRRQKVGTNNLFTLFVARFCQQACQIPLFPSLVKRDYSAHENGLSSAFFTPDEQCEHYTDSKKKCKFYLRINPLTKLAYIQSVGLGAFLTKLFEINTDI